MNPVSSCVVGRVEPFNCITNPPEGHGALYQGMRPQAWLRAIPGPLVVVNLDCDSTSGHWIDQAHTLAVLELLIEDTPEATLPDAVLLSAVEWVLGNLRGGLNVFVHCAMGSSRSSYLTLAVLMRLYGWSFDAALWHLRSRHDIAQPNRGFRAHLLRLEERLRSKIDG